MTQRWRWHVAFVLLVALAASGAPLGRALAQNCGAPPDPRIYSAAYANWCSCMGGIYNYQTTECVGARAPRTGGTPTRSEQWYCRAQARNGAWGWGQFDSQADAQSRAIAECRARSRGQACVIQYCRQGGPAAGGTATTQQRPQRATYACDMCEQKLRGDLQTGWASGRLRVHVQQAFIGYEMCKRKASGSCSSGDILVRTLRACDGFERSDAYRACIGRGMGW